MKDNLKLQKLSISLFVIAIVMLIAGMAACNSEGHKVVSSEPVYREAVSDSVFLRQADIDNIANQLKGEVKNQSKARETFTGFLVSICIVLLGVQISINRSNNRLNNTQAVLAATIGQKVDDIKDQVDDHENRIRGIEGVKQKRGRT